MQAWDRYAYSYGNPVKYIDPDGHSPVPPNPIPPIPYDEFITQAFNYFTGLGMQLVGELTDVIDKGIYTNGADMVFKYVEDGVTQVVGVELKNLGSRSVNLGTLGKVGSEYGGSMARISSSAGRFFKSSNAQLREESQAIWQAAKSGNLQNALYTNAQNVSNGAANVFNNIYTSAKDNTANIVKGFGSAASTAEAAAQTGLSALGGFLSGCETMFTGVFLYTPYNPFSVTNY